MGVLMSKIFPSTPVLEVDHIECCNQTGSDDSSSDDDRGVVYSGRLNAVMHKILETWPVSSHVDVHVRQRTCDIIEN